MLLSLIEVNKSPFFNLSFTGESSNKPTTDTPSPFELISYPTFCRATAIATFSDVRMF